MDWNFKHLEQTLNSKCLVETVGRHFSMTKSCRYMSKSILPQTNIKWPETSDPSPLIMPNIIFLRLEEESWDYTWWVHSDDSWNTSFYTIIKVSSIQIILNHFKRKEREYCPLYTWGEENMKKNCFHLIASTSEN